MNTPYRIDRMDFHEFLKEAAPLLGLQHRPFKRDGIRRRLERRIAEIGLSSFEAYLQRVREDLKERLRLPELLTVTISRFFREREVFEKVETVLIPALLRGREKGELKVWSIGCASGEEPYTLAILWKERFERAFPEVQLSILAADIEDRLLRRAKEGMYKESSLREVPKELLGKYFKPENGVYILDRAIREGVHFERHDILREEPPPGMDIVLCRNLAFTYFSKAEQANVLQKIASSLEEEGYLIIGKDETLPLMYPTLFVPAFPKEWIYQRFV